MDYLTVPLSSVAIGGMFFMDWNGPSSKFKLRMRIEPAEDGQDQYVELDTGRCRQMRRSMSDGFPVVLASVSITASVMEPRSSVATIEITP